MPGACVAWRATLCGTQYSSRLPLEDLPCSALIQPAAKRVSGEGGMLRNDSPAHEHPPGYCECSDQRLHHAEVALLCGKGLGAEWKRGALQAHAVSPALRRRPLAARTRPFTCQSACEDKLRRHGLSSREDASSACSTHTPMDELDGRWAGAAAPPLTPHQSAAVRALWEVIDAAFQVRRTQALPGLALTSRRRPTDCTLCSRPARGASAAGLTWTLSPPACA